MFWGFGVPKQKNCPNFSPFNHLPLIKLLIALSKMQKLIHQIDEVLLLPPDRSNAHPSVLAYGHTYTSGWENVKLVPLLKQHSLQQGIYQFRFVASPPENEFVQITNKVSALYVFPKECKVKKVQVYADSNSLDAAFVEGVCIDFGKSQQNNINHRLSVGYSDKLDFKEALKNAIKNFSRPINVRSAFTSGIRMVENGILPETDQINKKMYVIIEG